MHENLGDTLENVLKDIEHILLLNHGVKPNFTEAGLRASIYIFQCVMLDKMFELQEIENMDDDSRIAMATKMGNEIRNLIKTYTNVDSHALFNK